MGDAPASAPGSPLPGRAIAFLGCAGLLFVCLLAAAFSWDCARAVTSAYKDARDAEGEQRMQEDRILAALASAGHAGSDLDEAVAVYRASQEPSEQDRLFEGVLAAAARASRPETRADDPVARRALDELAGAQNRRAIAMRNRRQIEAAYNEAASGFRGALGRAITGLPARLP